MHASEITSTIFQHMICPYFTIAINDNMKNAKSQIMAFNASALYNRYLLRGKAMSVFKKSIPSDHVDHIRFYALTMVKSVYAFWCIRSNIKNRLD